MSGVFGGRRKLTSVWRGWRNDEVNQCLAWLLPVSTPLSDPAVGDVRHEHHVPVSAQSSVAAAWVRR